MIIINEAMAKKYWPKGDPLKDRLTTGVGMGPVFVEPARQIIGIVGDTQMAASIAIRFRRCTFLSRRCRMQRLRSTLVLRRCGGSFGAM